MREYTLSNGDIVQVSDKTIAGPALTYDGKHWRMGGRFAPRQAAVAILGAGVVEVIENCKPPDDAEYRIFDGESCV